MNSWWFMFVLWNFYWYITKKHCPKWTVFGLRFSETLEKSSRWQNNCFSVHTVDGDIVLSLTTKRSSFQIEDFLKGMLTRACGKLHSLSNTSLLCSGCWLSTLVLFLSSSKSESNLFRCGMAQKISLTAQRRCMYKEYVRCFQVMLHIPCTTPSTAVVVGTLEN